MKEIIEQSLNEVISRFGENSTLRQACEYALLSPGKRFRPALTFMVAEALGNKNNVSDAAIAIELFHTASLIADDLPCMDNDDFRRDRPSLHRKYGEATALLASYALIAAGYEQIARCARSVNGDAVLGLALENVAYNMGICGATGGQFHDLYPDNLTEDAIRDVLAKKTSTAYEIALVLGWLFGGGDPKRLDEVKALAGHFGLAFQIADDMGDLLQDIDNERVVNFPARLGVERALEVFHVELAAYYKALAMLSIDTPPLHQLGEQVEQMLNRATKITASV